MQQQPAAIIGILAAILLFAGFDQATAGTYVEQKVSSSQNGMNLKVQAWMEGNSGKVEFVKSDSDTMPKGSYLLTHDGGETVYLINPKKKTYSLWDTDALFATLGAMTKDAEGIIDIDFKDAEAEDLGTEPGGQLLGIDTTKKSWRTAYTMEMKVVFMERSRRIEATTDAWLTNEDSIPTLSSTWFAVKPPTTGDPDLDFVLSESMKRVDGTPLKVVQSTKMKDKKGRGKTSKMTMEITTLREESVDPNVFSMPEGYDEVPLFDLSEAGISAPTNDEDDPLKDLGGLFDSKEKDR